MVAIFETRIGEEKLGNKRPHIDAERVRASVLP